MKLQHLLAITLAAAAAPAWAGVESASGYWTGLGPQDFALTAGNGVTASRRRAASSSPASRCRSTTTWRAPMRSLCPATRSTASIRRAAEARAAGRSPRRYCT